MPTGNRRSWLGLADVLAAAAVATDLSGSLAGISIPAWIVVTAIVGTLVLVVLRWAGERSASAVVAVLVAVSAALVGLFAGAGVLELSVNYLGGTSS